MESGQLKIYWCIFIIMIMITQWGDQNFLMKFVTKGYWNRIILKEAQYLTYMGTIMTIEFILYYLLTFKLRN